MRSKAAERECRKRLPSKALLSVGVSLLTASLSFAQPLAAIVENTALKVQYISPGGYFLLIDKPSQRSFISVGTLSHVAGVATVTNMADKTFGAGQAIKVSYPDGSRTIRS